MLAHQRLTLFSLALLSAPLACADDVGTTIGTGESSTGTSTGEQTTANTPTTNTPTTNTPTTTVDPTTDTTDPSTTTDAVTITDSSTTPGETTDTTTGSTTDTTSSTTGETTDTTTSETTDTASSTGETTDTTGSSSTTGNPECTPGDVNCDCDQGTCNGQSTCILDKCLPVGDGSCFFEFDGECDEGQFCDIGSDPFDCCATAQNGQCEEFDFGGMCAPYSDFYDSAYCPFVDDLTCDAPNVCPADTDANDCCPTLQNATCEEMQAGGECPDGTDPYDCGVCLSENDGLCDVPFDCPESTDVFDCCATEEDGMCDEMQGGGECPDGSDPYDCGFCPYEDDGECDVPTFCPEGSDLNDCA